MIVDQEFEKVQRDDATEQDKLRREGDPNSIESKMAQDLAISMGMDPKQAAGLTALKFKEFSPVMRKKYEIEQRKLDRDEARAVQSADRQSQRESMNASKQATRDEKKKSMLNEVEDRRTNIEDNVSILEKMINDKGTYEVFGSHNADMGRLVDQIATDMAKLTDPNSVARPSEVEMFKTGLVKPGVEMKNSTALDILKNFRGEVNSRADNAYRIRGLDNPGSQADKAGGFPKTVTNEAGETASVSNQQEADEAKSEGYN